MESTRLEDDPFTWKDMERFIEGQFVPFMNKLDAHMVDDSKHFDTMNKSLSELHSTIKVQTAVGQAIAVQAEKFNQSVDDAKHSRLAHFGLFFAAATPIAAFMSLVVAVLTFLKFVGVL